MSEIISFLKKLEKLGISVSIKNSELKIQAPKGIITLEIQKELVEHKIELIYFLQKQENSNEKNKEKEMDFSLFFFTSEESVEVHEKYKLFLEAVKLADENNFAGIWTPERHFHKMGGLFPNPAVIGSAISTITQKVKIRAGSVVLPLQDPIRVAEEWSVVDNLSNGRVELSFATGWHSDDFVLAPDNYKDRKKIMFDRIPIVKKLWRGESIFRKAGSGKDIELKIYPKPIQKELPFWITAIGNPETYMKTGEVGANLMTCLLDQNIAEMTDKIDLYRKSLIDNGFDPTTKKVAVFLHTFIGNDYESTKNTVREPFTEYLKTTLDLLGKFGQNSDIALNPRDMSEEEQKTILDFAFEQYLDDRTFIGDMTYCMEMVKKLKEAGVDEIACLIDFGLSYNDIMSSLENLVQLKKRLALMLNT